MAREGTWNSRRKSSSHAHTSQVWIDSITHFVASVLYLFEKMGRMNGGEKGKGRLDFTENSPEQCTT